MSTRASRTGGRDVFESLKKGGKTFDDLTCLERDKLLLYLIVCEFESRESLEDAKRQTFYDPLLGKGDGEEE